jgi:hypothetical protein
VRYYLERRDPEFKQKSVYREVELIKETAAAAKQERSDAVAIISYDELCRPRRSSSYAAGSTIPSELGIEYQQYQVWLDRLGIVCPVASLPAPHLALKEAALAKLKPYERGNRSSGRISEKEAA